ncbi:TetR/AcrR family transcriptional regulator [Edaphovirga cremea]|uniref:TetR/AcrR family transcriptional regulator n=1 Tax=Edaphovirga cremea TaxID=2267246 RepID=UPI000DEF6ADD|nr:TetR/AcrR family transcriptional regulator [Edaphovirga cremea]
MKVNREQAAANRERVLDTAARLFRERGFDGIGVAELMKNAGLTHGGFYANFSSKEDLIAQASARILERNADYWRSLAQTGGDKSLREISADYLRGSFESGVGTGCLLAALGAESARQGESVRQVIASGVNEVLSAATQSMPGETEKQRRHQAMVTYAATIGALVLARATDDASLAEEIFQAVANAMPESDK